MHFGPPKTLRTDGETAILRSEIFQRFLKTYGIDHAPTAPSSPWSNGLAERMVAKYKEAIRSYAKSHQDTDISEFLSIISNSFNQTPTTYGPTPSELMYGIKDLKTGKVRKAHFDHLVAVTATNQISNLNPEGVDLSS